MSKIVEILVEILATALSAAIIYYIRVGIEYVKSRTKSAKVDLALREFQIVLEDGVGYVEQTIVKTYKDKGTWDKNAQSIALQACADYIKGNLTKTTLDILTEDKTNIEVWIKAKIQALIHYTKS